MHMTVGGTDKERTRTRHVRLGASALLATGVALGSLVAAGSTAGGATAKVQSSPPIHRPMSSTIAGVAADPVARSIFRSGSRSTGSVLAHQATPDCTYNGLPTDTVVPGVTPGGSIAISCTGWTPDDQIQGIEISPLSLDPDNPNPTADTDTNDVQNFTADASGNLNATFIVPNPFVAADPAAVCPPTPTQVTDGFLRCGLLLSDGQSNADYDGIGLAAFDYAVATPSAASVVGMAAMPDGGGYWLAWNNGTVTTHGDALNYGDASQLTLDAPIAHIVATADGEGYWLVASDGGTFAFGNAGFYGSMGGQHLNEPVVDLAPTADGGGYWLVASDGGIFAFGDARFYGSMGGQVLNKPVVGISADGATGGYWEVATDGGIFAFNAPFFGSTGSIALNKPVNGMTDQLRWLPVRRLRRWRVRLWGRRLLRVGREPHSQRPCCRHGPRPQDRRLLAGGERRRNLLVQRPFLRGAVAALPATSGSGR